MNEVRIAIIGCGGISRAHVNAYRQAGGARLACVFDVNPAAADKLAQETGARTVPALEALANPAEVDAVSICTPPAFHLENCRPFLRARIPVLCEKPLEVTVARAQKLAREIRQHRAVFMVAFCHRFHPPIIEAKRILQEGVLGRPLLFRCTFAGKFPLQGNHRADPKLAGGGCLADNAAHAVDIFRFLIADVAAVQAQTGNLAQDAAVEDYGAMLLRGRNGCAGEIVTSYSLPMSPNFVEVQCANGSVTVNYWVAGRPDLVYRIDGEKEDRTVDLRQRPDRFVGEVAHFLACARSGQTPAVNAADGLAAVKVIAAAYASAKTGRLVQVR
jgi:predicted dehydrogenase